MFPWRRASSCCLVASAYCSRTWRELARADSCLRWQRVPRGLCASRPSWHAAKIKEHDVSKGPLIGLVLTALAGWVDAIGYLRLGGFFPSFMSGNTTQLGIALSHADWISAALPALLVGLFVTGAFAGATIADCGTRWRFVVCFLLETLLLGTAVLLSAAQSDVALAVAPL